ncbi:MAG TPA: GIY-YIG nuclease family protein [Chitinispirillaceae bacterium]|nr:GIY-YIG nuclease family protein [Chitinispirillaceae bacterium]
MKTTEFKEDKTSKKPWFLYILLCNDNSLYTGITNCLDSRIKSHQSGIAARYTRGRLPVKLVYAEKCNNRSDASKREWIVKKMSKKQKLELVKKGCRDLFTRAGPNQLTITGVCKAGNE